MSRRTRTIEQTDTIGEILNGGELSTTHLTASNLETDDQQPNESTTDWWALLTAQPTATRANQTPRQLQPAPSGMTEHRTPPRMVPTAGSRLTTGLRRTILLATLAVLAIGALAVGAYAVSTTTWVSQLLWPPAPPITTTEPPTNATDSTIKPQAPAEAEPKSQPPSNTTAIELRDKGIELYKAGDFNASIDLLQDSLNLQDTDAVTHYQLGLAFMAATERDHALDDAEMAFRTAISLQPTWAAPHQLLAESLVRRGFYVEAIPPALEATKLAPTQADAWLTLGRAYQGAGQQTEAAQAFAQAARQGR